MDGIEAIGLSLAHFFAFFVFIAKNVTGGGNKEAVKVGAELRRGRPAEWVCAFLGRGQKSTETRHKD
ncbi:MAG: hypothetical protein HF978_21990 [Desulfobacteraceae bacterium]|nr:hypothetical protein [Desulfobacteraceae bacterium]MBC2758214.1 hypothetical protein [Desulfobacteraceae bacterium]